MSINCDKCIKPVDIINTGENTSQLCLDHWKEEVLRLGKVKEENINIFYNNTKMLKAASLRNEIWSSVLKNHPNINKLNGGLNAIH